MRSGWSALIAALMLLAVGRGAVAEPPAEATVQTVRVSVASSGAEANAASAHAAVSADGRFVAFASFADNLVAGDANGTSDVFIHDLLLGTTTRVSVASGGIEANGRSSRPSISADGRLVAFESEASNLTPGDASGRQGVFVHDRLSGITTRVSGADDDVDANGDSWLPHISADGRIVAFQSLASNLSPGDRPGTIDVFVHDRTTATTRRVTAPPVGGSAEGGGEIACVSPDGRYVGFHSIAAHLVAGDNNGLWDAFVFERATGTTSRVSVADDGRQGTGNSFLPSIAVDARRVAFFSDAPDLVPGDANRLFDVYVRDVRAGTTTLVSMSNQAEHGDGDSGYPSISATGACVAFESRSTNLVDGDSNGTSDVFVRDLEAERTERASVAYDGAQAQGVSEYPRISADGSWVAFVSTAANLVADDSNGHPDVFVRRITLPCTAWQSTIELPWVGRRAVIGKRVHFLYLPSLADRWE